MPVRSIFSLLPAVGLMLLLAWTPGIGMQEDLGRHLRLGRLIVAQRTVPATNYLTHTHPDHPFVNHHWLSEVLLYGLHRQVGHNGLIVFKMALMAGALGLAMAAVRPATGLAGYALCGILAAIILGFRAHVRPELFSYLALAIYLAGFERIRQQARRANLWRWLILATGFVWVNAHIYFIFGLGLAAAFALERAALGDRSARCREGAWIMGMVGVSLLNPNGIHGLVYPLRIFDNYAVSLVENAAPMALWQNVLNPMLMVLPLFSLLVVAAGAVTLRRHRTAGHGLKETLPRVRPANLAAALVGLVLAWSMARNVPLLALSGLPVIAAGIDDIHDAKRRFGISRLKRTGTALVAAVTVLLATAILTGAYARPFPAPIGPTPPGFDDGTRYGAIRRLVDDHGLKGPVFTDYNLGSLVEYQIDPLPGYVDNRPEAFPADFWETEYAPAVSHDHAFAAVCRRRGINAVMASLTGSGETFIPAMMRRPDWALVHLDDLGAVWARRTPDHRALIDRLELTPSRLDAYVRDLSTDLLHLPDHPWWQRTLMADRVLMRLYALVCIGAADRARPYVLQLAHLYPDYQFVHELLWATTPAADPLPFADILEHRARWPLAAKQVTDWAAYLVRRGELREARRVLDRGRRFFPFSPVVERYRQQVTAMLTEQK